MSAELDLIKMKALGRRFTLGTLYNYTNDNIISNFYLWDPRTVNRLTINNHEDREQIITVHKLLATDPEENDLFNENKESDNLEIDDHSVMSLMAGLVIPSSGGAWHYIVDRANWTVGPFGRGSEVAVHCHSSSKKISIDPNDQLLEIVCTQEGLLKNNVTHVVVAVSYGLEALCIFSHYNQPEKWPNLGERDQSVMERMRDCAYHFAANLLRGSSGLGDGHHIIPTDFQTILYSDLIETDRNGQSWTSQPVARQYEACREVLDHQLHQAIPLEVWLYPIQNLREFKGASSIGRMPANPSPGISNYNLMIRCQLLLDQLQRARVQSNSLLTQLDKSNDLKIQNWNFPAIRQRIQEFQKSLKIFLQVILMAMRHWTVSTRQDEAAPNEDHQVVRILDVIVSKSPFAAQELSSWISYQREQIATLESFTQLPGVNHLPGSKQVLDNFIENGGDSSYALVLHLPNLTTQSDNLVQEMKRYIDAFGASGLTSWAGEVRNQGPAVDYRPFLKTGQEFSNWVNSYNNKTAFVHYAIFYDEQTGQTPFWRLYCCGTDDSWTVNNIPEAPGQVEIKENDRGVITLSWTYGEKSSIWQGFLFQYRNVNQPDGHYETIQQLIRTNTITIDTLEPDEIYVFRVAAETLAGRSSFGPVSNEVKISSICPPPSNIQVKCVTDSIITLAWDHYVDPQGPIRIISYSTDCWVDGGEEPILIQRTTTDKEVTIEPLDRDTLYQIEIRAVYADASGSTFSGPAGPVWAIRTKRETERPAQIVRRASSRFVTGTRSDIITTHNLTLTKLPTSIPSVEHYAYGERLHSALFGKRRQRTVLMVGATGSGKTTLINAMVNYILGVEWEDDFRFKLIDESAIRSQTQSQTDLVTTYDVYHTKGSRLEYSLTVVDTPGFGDTRGVEKDQKMLSQIENYFKCQNGIRQLEAVCIVVEASLPRLTPTQKYIFDSILSIFGHDIKDNIRLMVTFADNAEPPVLAAIKEVNIPTSSYDRETGLPIYHKFNSSIFFENNKKDRHTNEINRTYFDMCVESFESFFNDLSQMDTKSLLLTREVLKERRKLQVLVESLQMRTETNLTRGNELDKIKKILTDNTEKMEANQNVEFEVEILISKTVDISGSGQLATNCLKCRSTCHFPCRQDNYNKDMCSVMDSNAGYCWICKCPWNDHYQDKNYRYEKVKEKKKQSLDSIRESYQVAASEALNNEKLLEKINKEINDIETQLLKLKQATSQHVQRLEEIALRPHRESTTAYIDLMIEGEKKGMKVDFQERIAGLQKLRRNAEFNQSVIVEQMWSPPRGQTDSTDRIDPAIEQQMERHNSRKEKDIPLGSLKADLTESIEVNQASARPDERQQPAVRNSLLDSLTSILLDTFSQMKVVEEKEKKSDP